MKARDTSKERQNEISQNFRTGALEIFFSKSFISEIRKPRPKKLSEFSKVMY